MQARGGSQALPDRNQPPPEGYKRCMGCGDIFPQERGYWSVMPRRINGKRIGCLSCSGEAPPGPPSGQNAPFQPGSATSREAAASVAGLIAPQEWEVLAFIAGCSLHGAIRDECEQAVDGLKTPAACARLNALENAGLIACGGDRRRGLSGRFQKIYRITETGRDRLASKRRAA